MHKDCMIIRSFISIYRVSKKNDTSYIQIGCDDWSG